LLFNAALPQEVTVGLLLLIVLIVVVISILPRWNHSREWGYGPSSVLGLILIVFLFLLLFDVVHWRTFHVSY
jgi:Protein of unknown function (DUF3309)